MYEKKKVIVSKLDGLTEPFAFGDIGLILQKTDVEAVKKAFLTVKTTKDYTPSNKVWETIHNFYSWETIGLKTKNIYESLE